ncbi:MAG: GGDEF domain-containing protein [Planctomycetes bacterium]|nr:GGDEF domain-containing protein [Planctomycetota bacterium]
MDILTLGLPVPVALAAVAVIGYLFGRRSPRPNLDGAEPHREIKRARAIILELENIARKVRRNLATHHASVLNFKERIANLGADETDESAWKELCRESENILKPTMALCAQIAHAHDEIRQQTNQLMSFAEVRTDPLTGLNNRRALDETLSGMFAMMARYETVFSLTIFDIDHFKEVNDEEGHLFGDEVLKKAARLFRDTVRDTDTVVRYGGEEFVVIMPETDLDGACLFTERIRQAVERELSITISGGVARAVGGDNSRTLLARADSALYRAKAGGRNCTYRHTGEVIETVPESVVAGVLAGPDEAATEEPVAHAHVPMLVHPTTTPLLDPLQHVVRR